MPIRTRSDNSPSMESCVFTQRDMLTGSATTASIGPYATGEQTSRSMTDFVTPEFKKLRGRGLIVNNDLHSTKKTLTCPIMPFSGTSIRIGSDGIKNIHTVFSTDKGLSLDVYMHDVMTYYYDSSTLNTVMGPAYDPLPGEESAALTRAYAKANDSDVLALVSLAEATKTLKSVKDATFFMRDRLIPFIGFLSTKRGRRMLSPNGLLKGGTEAAKLWLEYRYSIMTTIYEIQSYIDLVQTRKKSRRVRFVSSKEGTVTIESSNTTSAATFYNEHRQISRKRTDIVSAGLLVQPSPYALEGMGDRAGFDRLVSSAWELVPFSFVIDWFLNTSDFLSAHEGRFRFDVLASWTSRRSSVHGLYGLVTENRNYVSNGESYSGSYQRDYSAFDTVVRNVRVANPTLSYLPTVKLNLNWKKVTDLAALSLTISNLSKHLRL